MRTISLAAVAALMLSMPMAMSAPGAAEPLPSGSGERRLDLGDVRLTVFTYRPACSDPSLLLVLHGQNHNADDYRDWARPLADGHCLLVVAPRFAKSQFPRWRYQHGGIARDGAVQDPSEWTGRLVLDLVERIRQLEGRRMPYSLIGHSAGGQFLSRLAAFTPTEAQRIVIANPGTHVLADPKVEAPYGFGGVYARDAMDQHLRRYLSAPLTIFLGHDDTDEEGLSRSREANAQGATRHERGRNAFEAAQALAQARRWPFNWRLVEVPGVGHRAKKMFAAPEASDALKP
jgi:pimeloyl-ACP methyl ester carboxylesterase